MEYRNRLINQRGISLLQVTLIVVFIAIVAAIIGFNANRFKPDVEVALSNNLNLSSSLGEIEYSLLAPGTAHLSNILIGSKEQGFYLAAKKISTTVSLIPLINKHLIVEEVVIDSADIQLSEQGIANFLGNLPKTDSDSKQPATEPDAELLIKHLKVNNARVSFASDLPLKLSGITLSFDNINLKELPKRVLSKALQGQVSIADINIKDVSLGKLNSTFSWKGETARLDKLTLGDSQRDWLTISVSGASNLKDLSQSAQLNLEKLALNTRLLNEFLPTNNIKSSGTLSLLGNLTAPLQAQSLTDQLSQLSGSVGLQSEGLTLTGIDIDKLVSSLKDSQKMDLKDVGGFLLSGPVGILVGNLLDLGSGAASGGETRIEQISLSSAINQGVLDIANTALATSDNRLAFRGGIDLGKQSFAGFDFAVLDEKGCATIKQTLNGDIYNPTSAIANTLMDSAISPIKGLLSRLGKIAGTKCEVFYNGDVPHPVKH